MKKCPYCGKEYSDDVSFCAIDRNFLEPSDPVLVAETAQGAEEWQGRRLIAMVEPVLTGLTVHQSIPLHPGFNQLGRNPTNDYRIADATISSFHCEIEVSHISILVRDLNSTNGTFIDGKKIQEAELKGGQTLKIGDVEFRLEDWSVRVAIPKQPAHQGPPAPKLPEGAFPCFTHSETIALWKCTECQKTFCGSCVREIRRKGGNPLRFCKSCRGQCEALPEQKPKKKISLLGRLTQTIRILRR